jgi:hypothetical protein
VTRWLLAVPAVVVAAAALARAVQRRRGRTDLTFARQRLHWIRLSLEADVAKLPQHCGPDLLQSVRDAVSVLNSRADELTGEPDDRPGLLGSLADRYDGYKNLSFALPVIADLERNRVSAHDGVQRATGKELVKRLAAADGRRMALTEALRSANVEGPADTALRRLTDEYLSISVDAYLTTGQAFDDWATDARRRAGQAEPHVRQTPPAPRDDDPDQPEWNWPL